MLPPGLGHETESATKDPSLHSQFRFFRRWRLLLSGVNLEKSVKKIDWWRLDAETCAVELVKGFVIFFFHSKVKCIVFFISPRFRGDGFQDLLKHSHLEQLSIKGSLLLYAAFVFHSITKSRVLNSVPKKTPKITNASNNLEMALQFFGSHQKKKQGCNEHQVTNTTWAQEEYFWYH